MCCMILWGKNFLCFFVPQIPGTLVVNPSCPSKPYRFVYKDITFDRFEFRMMRFTSKLFHVEANLSVYFSKMSHSLYSSKLSFIHSSSFPYLCFALSVPFPYLSFTLSVFQFHAGCHITSYRQL